MSKSTVIFLPFHIRHWDMYIPLVEPLQNMEYDVKFFFIDGFHYTQHLPGSSYLNGLEVHKVRLSASAKPKSKTKEFRIIYSELLPSWKRFLKSIDHGVIVSPDYMALHRLMINSNNNPKIKVATLQDGHYAGLPRSYGWELENSYRTIVKKIVLRTPMKRFINLAFGAAADHLGLYGNTLKERLVKEAGFKRERLTVVGSTRHATFKEQVKRLDASGNTFTIFCLPTTFPLCHDDGLYNSQDLAMQWMLDAAIELNEKTGYQFKLVLKVKFGYDSQVEHYKQLLGHPMVEVVSGTAKLEDFFSKADLVVTTGSTSGLEAAICNIPILQIAPEYLKRKLTFIANLPLAETAADVKEYMEKALTDNKDFIKNYCADAHEEMANVNPEWDSVKETANWLNSICRDDK